MNKTQRKILIVAAATILIMIMFPPFETSINFPMGYHFIAGEDYGKVNIGLLLTQLAGVAIVGGILTAAFKGKDK